MSNPDFISFVFNGIGKKLTDIGFYLSFMDIRIILDGSDIGRFEVFLVNQLSDKIIF
jgi:hypothetical protein